MLRMPDIYTIFENGEPNLVIENFFSGVEKSFVRARRAIEAGNKLEPEQIAIVYNFVAAMMVRRPAHIEHWQRQWAHIVNVMENIRIRPGAKPMPSIGSSGHSISLPEVQKMASDPMGTWFKEHLDAQTKVLAEFFRFDILVNGSPHPFLTSDQPAVVSWPEEGVEQTRGRPRRPRGLGSPGCTIVMPISPGFGVVFGHGRIGSQPIRLELDWEAVFEANFMTITRARETIISDRADLFFVQTVLNRVAEVEGVEGKRRLTRP